MTPTGLPEPLDQTPSATPEQLFAYLRDLGIDYSLHHHPAVFTVAESVRLDRNLPGVQCRNLFLRDRKKIMFLVVAANETRIDLKKLEALIGSDRLSFGSPERLWGHLGVRPGSVCPYALINDRQGVVNVILDAYMMRSDIVNYHPLVNTMTIGVRPDDLLTFIRSTGHDPKIVDLGMAAPD
jgi:Ala-tRNA(Pro) deacylase